MPPNARRRHTKIVAPLTQNREQELIGGLKNALERGEPLAKAKQSFINAGYKQKEVEMAAQKVPTTTTPIQPVPTQTSPATPTQPIATTPTATAVVPGQKKKLSKKFLIILISSGVLVLIIAALLGIFWGNIFG